MERAILSLRTRILDGFSDTGMPIHTCIYTPDEGDPIVITLRTNYSLERIGMDARARFVEILRGRYGQIFENTTFIYVNETDTTMYLSNMERQREKCVNLVQMLHLETGMERQIIGTMPVAYDGMQLYTAKRCSREYDGLLGCKETINFIIKNHLQEFQEYLEDRQPLDMKKLAYLATKFADKKKEEIT